MKRCPKCNWAWNNRKPNPSQCPKCKARLTNPSSNPNHVSMALISKEKKRTILALNHLPKEADGTVTQTQLLSRIETLEWVEAGCPNEEVEE